MLEAVFLVSAKTGFHAAKKANFKHSSLDTLL